MRRKAVLMKRKTINKIKKTIGTSTVAMAVAVLLLTSCGSAKEGDVDDSSQKYLPTKVTVVDNGEVLSVKSYTYDEHQNPVTCVKEEAEEQLTDTFDNTYREDGTLEKVVMTGEYDPEENGEIFTEKTTFKFDEQGKMISKEDENWTEKYAFNEDGQLIKQESLPDGKEAYKTISEYKYKDSDDENLSQLVEIWNTYYDNGKVNFNDIDCTISYSKNGYITHIQYPEDADGFPYWDYKYENKDGLITKITYYYETDVYDFLLEYDTSDPNTELSNDRYVKYINNIDSSSIYVY